VSAPAQRTGSYQVVLVGLLSLNFGIVFFDRNALNFLMPFVQPSLGLSNTEVGFLSAALSLTWALSGFMLGRSTDRTGKRKAVIVWATVGFSLCSFVSGLATSFAMLLAARLLMGIAEGGVLPISQSLTASEVVPRHRGLAMGFMQNFGSNALGSTVAPILLVAIATGSGWRNAFYLAGIPGLVSAFLIWRFVREAAPTTRQAPATERLSMAAAFAERNIVLCSALAILMVSHAIICWTFMPLFLTRARGFSPEHMGWLMAVLGVSASLGGFLLPALSDRVGRKPVMVIVPAVSAALPLAALFFHGEFWALAALFFVGWGLNSLFPLAMAAIPAETVDVRYTSTALAFVMGAGEVIGGVLGPAGAGVAADSYGLGAPLWIMLVLCAASMLLALCLKETAPRILRRRHDLVASGVRA